jgi:hypothetical protein
MAIFRILPVRKADTRLLLALIRIKNESSNISNISRSRNIIEKKTLPMNCAVYLPSMELSLTNGLHDGVQPLRGWLCLALSPPSVALRAPFTAGYSWFDRFAVELQKFSNADRKFIGVKNNHQEESHELRNVILALPSTAR